MMALKPVRPLFGGYALVAFVCAWLAGDWLAGQGSLEGLAPALWLVAGVVGLALAVGAALFGRRYGLSPRWRRASRITLAAGALLLWLGLGAGRASAADPMRDPRSIAHYASGATTQAQEQIVAEPDEHGGYRILTVRVSSITLDGGQTQAVGDVEATVYGLDDWFAPAYGDPVTLTGKLDPLGSDYAPAGVVARMPSARARILARGGGIPLMAALYQWRVALA